MRQQRGTQEPLRIVTHETSELCRQGRDNAGHPRPPFLRHEKLLTIGAARYDGRENDDGDDDPQVR